MSISAFIVDFLRLCLWLIILVAIFVPLERIFAIEPRPILRKGIATDIGLYFLNSLLPTALLALPMAAVAAVTKQLLPDAWMAAVSAMPLWVRLALTFLIGEIGFYWGHRWSHEWHWMWRFHRVHHSPESLDWLINARAHPIDMIFTRLCGLVPLYAVGLAAPTLGGSVPAMLVVVVGTIWGFFIHANLAWRFGIIEHVIATPRFHHWHHVRTGPINRNYAAMVPVLDRVFGTLHLPGRAWPDAYGIDHEAERMAMSKTGPSVSQQA